MDSDQAWNISHNRTDREIHSDVVLSLTPTHCQEEFEETHLDAGYLNLDKQHNCGVEEEEEGLGGDEVDHVEYANVFATKKSLAQGMMDVALITANANQLRYIIEFNRHSRTFYFLFSMIIISIMLQVIVGISLILMTRTTVSDEQSTDKAVRRNKSVLIGVFVITVINVFIATFPITDQPVVNIPLPPSVSSANVLVH